MPPMRQRGLEAVRQAVEATPHPDDMPTMAEIEDRTVILSAQHIPIRIYRPHNDSGSSPALVYFHGGGLVMGSVNAFEPLARALAATSGATVISVEYRLAPENPPPAQFDDAYAATSWVAAHTEELGIDAARLAVVGDSAGGTLAAAVALAARDRGGPSLFAQVLMYPGLDKDLTVPSVQELPEAPMLSLIDIEYMHELADGPEHPYTVPARASDLCGLPQAIVATAAADPIRDWGERYAARLRDAGVQTTLTRYPGAYHGFLMRSDATARGRLAVAEIGALMRAKFANPLPF
ncbi:alpha/beta hydrolase [Mycolicibacterium gadium]|nr:alpha/beta hydrolase [Mycolicibacterium gadium]